MELKTVVVERWETMVKNITELQVRDEDDNIISSESIFSEDIESIDGADKYIFSVDEFLETSPMMTEQVKQSEEALLLLAQYKLKRQGNGTE